MNETFKANFQRIGAVSNAHVGRDFETIAENWLAQNGVRVQKDFAVPLSVDGRNCKPHKFDLGSRHPNILVECKSHTWTAGDKVPSAKITTWDQAMYYFLLAPREYRKIMFVLRDISKKRQESLAEYYVRIKFNLIPHDVEVWEYCAVDFCTKRIHL